LDAREHPIFSNRPSRGDGHPSYPGSKANRSRFDYGGDGLIADQAQGSFIGKLNSTGEIKILTYEIKNGIF